MELGTISNFGQFLPNEIDGYDVYCCNLEDFSSLELTLTDLLNTKTEKIIRPIFSKIENKEIGKLLIFHDILVKNHFHAFLIPDNPYDTISVWVYEKKKKETPNVIPNFDFNIYYNIKKNEIKLNINDQPMNLVEDYRVFPNLENVVYHYYEEEDLREKPYIRAILFSLTNYLNGPIRFDYDYVKISQGDDIKVFVATNENFDKAVVFIDPHKEQSLYREEKLTSTIPYLFLFEGINHK